jgi:hypothetical protein
VITIPLLFTASLYWYVEKKREREYEKRKYFDDLGSQKNPCFGILLKKIILQLFYP